jgi:hypothetical protein
VQKAVICSPVHTFQQQYHLHSTVTKTWYASLWSTCCLYLVTNCLHEEYLSINFLLLPCTMSTPTNTIPAPIFTQKSRNRIVEKQVTEAHTDRFSEGMPFNELYKIIWGTRRFVIAGQTQRGKAGVAGVGYPSMGLFLLKLIVKTKPKLNSGHAVFVIAEEGHICLVRNRLPQPSTTATIRIKPTKRVTQKPKVPSVSLKSSDMSLLSDAPRIFPHLDPGQKWLESTSS